MNVKPLRDAPKTAKSFKAQAPFHNVLSKDPADVLAVLKLLEKGSGEVFIVNNGSFHEYDYTIEYRFNIKKYNTEGLYPKYGEYIDVNTDTEARDYDIIYLGPDDYNIFVTKNLLEKTYILDESNYRDYDFQKKLKFSTTEEIMAFLDSERGKAIEFWKLSRKNF